MQKSYLEVFDTSRRLIGILENAADIREEMRINAVWHLKFSLPYGDVKNALCRPFNFVRYAGGEMYRIMAGTEVYNENGYVEYRCEHVIALLLDDMIFGVSAFGGHGIGTAQVIRYVLSYQQQQDWVLDVCDFSFQLEYSWENEALLTALKSISSVIPEPFMWEYNTNTYPFRLSLRRLTRNRPPQLFIRPQKNLKSLRVYRDDTRIATRLYPMGAGEGINQVRVTEINGGVPFIQSPAHIIAAHGGRIVSRPFVAREYNDPQMLIFAARAALNELQEAHEEYEIDFASIDANDIPQIGMMAEIQDSESVRKRAAIVGIDHHHSEIAKTKIYIANRPRDATGYLADMADRLRIEMTHSQGATNIFQDHIYDNADQNSPLPLILNLRPSMRFINEIFLDVEIRPFRMPFAVTENNPQTTTSQSNTTTTGPSSISTTYSGGGHTSGPSSQNTTAAGGGQEVSSTMVGVGAGFNPIFSVQTGGSPPHAHALPNFAMVGNVAPHSHNMHHTHWVESHSHNMMHTHQFAHNHTIPAHSHTLTPRITNSGFPTSFTLRINGVNRLSINRIGNGPLMWQGDIAQWMVNASGQISRTQRHIIEVVPDAPAYCMITVTPQTFIQSRGNERR